MHARPRPARHPAAAPATCRPRSRKRSWLLVLALAPSLSPAATLVVAHTADAGAGSLRQAILDANATTDPDTIVFAIPGAGPHTIAPLTALPTITQPIAIDGLTQPGSLANTRTPADGGLDAQLMIELSGVNIPNGTGLNFNQNGSIGENLVRGLVINRFANGIDRFAGLPTRIEGNYIGTDPTGTMVPADMALGIHLRIAGADRIGGTEPAQRNLVSGCARGIGGTAIDFDRLDNDTAPVIQGNLIGTDATGLLALPNDFAIRLQYRDTPASGPGVLIGGDGVAARNVISGNLRHAITLSCSGGSSGPCAGGARIQGNFIGTDALGIGALGNGTTTGDAAINLYNQTVTSTRVLIGGGPGEGNRIAFNRGHGVRHDGAHGALEIVGNTLFANRGDSIALPGPRINDPGDADTGANRLQNHPELLSIGRTDDVLSITYRVDSHPAHAAYPIRVQFFRSTGGRDGLELLGEDLYPEPEATFARAITLALPEGSGPLYWLSATATDALGHTSEFADDAVLIDPVFRDGFE